MTVFEKIKSMNINEFADYLNECWIHDNDPSMEWWNEKYCNNCESVNAYFEYINREMECAWCEINGEKCKFFPEFVTTPNSKEIIKLWLESEYEQD